MNPRDDRRTRRISRRLLNAVLVVGIGCAVVLMASGSNLSIASAATEQHAAAVVAHEWLGIPVGIAVWLGLGGLALVVGMFSSLRSPELTGIGKISRSRPGRLLEHSGQSGGTMRPVPSTGAADLGVVG